MEIRRPIAALMTALALFGGGATLAGCSNPAGNVNTGTTNDSNNTAGNNPGSNSQGNLPSLSNRKPGSNPERGSHTGKGTP
jgi:hypothetical protein